MNKKNMLENMPNNLNNEKENTIDVAEEVKSIQRKLSLMAKQIIDGETKTEWAKWTELESFIDTIPSNYQLESPYNDFINLFKQRSSANGNDSYGITVLQNTAQEFNELLKSIADNKVE